MTTVQGDLQMGEAFAAREMTSSELAAQAEFFRLAERFQGYVAQKLRELLREPAYDQRIFNDVERTRRAQALMKCAYDGAFDSKERHKNWCDMHTAQGWVFGPEFRPDLKQHNNLVPWEELPVEARVKADIFALVAVFTADILKLAIQHLSRAEQVQQIRVLANLPLDENDVPEEVMSKRLTAIAELLEGDTDSFVNEVLARVNVIRERSTFLKETPDDVVSALTEALTVGR